MVHVRSSFAYAVEPRVFEHEGMIHHVEKITCMWRTPNHIHFYVRDEQEQFFELTYEDATDKWSIREFGQTCPPKE